MSSSFINRNKMPFSHIKEIKNIRDLLKDCHFNTLIVFDLDNTVIESETELGSDQWFSFLVEYACTVIPNKAEAISLVISIYHAVQHHVSCQPVEKDTIKIINALQAIGIPCLALTARGKGVIEPTLRQLKELDISFSKSWQNLDSFDLEIEDKRELPHYRNGILFCSGRDKGDCLETFLKYIKYYPPEILGVDDKLHHLHGQERTALKIGSNFTGLRYSYLDEKVKNMRILEAASQLNQLTVHLPQKVNAAIRVLDCDNKDNIHFLKMSEKHLFFSDKKTNEEQTKLTSEVQYRQI